MRTLTLGMIDRVALRQLLEECSGSYGMLVLARKLREEALSRDEMKALNLRTEGNALLWDVVDKATGKPLNLEKEVTFGNEAEQVIIKNLLRMNEAEALQQMHERLYELFILTPVER